MPSEKTIEVIRQITPAVAEHAETITRRFYEMMFAGNPEVQSFFNPAHQRSGGQQRALAGAICSYFSNIDNLGALGPAIEVIAQKHCSLGIEPNHYPIVGKHLLAAIKEVMGAGATDDVMQAVAEAYGVLADICIAREQEIYAAQAAIEGGWNGFRHFIVDKMTVESDNVKSFYLRPEDGRPLPDFKPGQYITLRVDHPDVPTAPRNYSLSDLPGTGYFRISVKQEAGASADTPAGLVSTFLHREVKPGQVLEVGPPCGEFTMDADTVDDRPVVFLAGGIGITPLLTMAKSLVDFQVLAPIHFIHAVKNSAVHPFFDEVQQMVSDKDFVQTLFVYDEPLDGDVETGKCDLAGLVDLDLLRTRTPYRDADFYFCGPRPFMQNVYAGLKQLGVPESRIHFEFFGPRQEIAAPTV